MVDRNSLITHVFLKVDGADVPEAVMNALISIEVDDSLHLPDMFIIQVRDPKLDFTESETFGLGKSVEISVKEGSSSVKLMSGEITALEPTLNRSTGPTLLVRGYDLSHRLHRGRQTKTFIQMTDSDIAAKVAKEIGLKSKIDPTREVYDYVLQNNRTNMEFLQERAKRIGYRLYVEDGTLHFRQAPDETPQVPELEWGINLLDFRARVTTSGQAGEVMVRGWDPKKKKEILGRATAPQRLPQIGIQMQGGQAAQRAFGVKSKEIVVDRPVTTQGEADALAQSICDEIGHAFVKADGACLGNARVAAGSAVKIKSVGDRFSGQYLVTHSLHRYDTSGYTTNFEISGHRPETIGSLLGSNHKDTDSRSGVVIGIVTNNNDPEGWGRVKVKFPWQADQLESQWARVATPMAGPNRGIQFIPEVNDEVLVAFEHGDMHRPYVIGSLWNGVDSPPKKSDEVVSATGKVNQRIIKSRSGHTIVLDDTDGSERITITDKTGKNTITIDSQSNKMTIEAQGDIEIKSGKKVTIQGTTGVEINGQPGSVDIKGTRLNLN